MFQFDLFIFYIILLLKIPSQKTQSDNPSVVLSCKHIIIALTMKNLNQLTQPILEKLLGYLIDP
jgi:hypothetical protein